MRLFTAVLLLALWGCASPPNAGTEGEAGHSRTYIASADRVFQAAVAAVNARKMRITRQDADARTLVAVAPGSWLGSDTVISLRVRPDAKTGAAVEISAPAAEGASMTFRPHWPTLLLADIEQQLTPSAPPR